VADVEFRKDDEGKGVICIRGNLTMATVPAVRNNIKKLTPSDGLKETIVDLASIDRMDTAGVALLVELCSKKKKKGCSFKVVNPDEMVRKVIRLAQLEQLLTEEGLD